MSWKSNRNKFGSVLSTKIIGAIDFEEVEFFEFPKENLPKVQLQGKFLQEIWELRVKLDLSEMSWKSNRNKFGSVLSRNIELASELDEVKIFEFPKENLPKEKLQGKFDWDDGNLGENLTCQK